MNMKGLGSRAFASRLVNLILLKNASLITVPVGSYHSTSEASRQRRNEILCHCKKTIMMVQINIACKVSHPISTVHRFLREKRVIGGIIGYM
jgi:hypothetical protein